MGSEDYLLEAVAGALQGVASVYVPRKQAEYQNNLTARREAANREAEFDLYRRKLPLEEESQIRIHQAKQGPPQMTEVADPMTGRIMRTTPNKIEFLRPPTIDGSQREEQKLSAKMKGLAPKARRAVSEFSASAENTIQQIDEILSDPNFEGSTGFMGKQKARFEGTSSYDVRAKIESIKAAVSLNALTNMRMVSPTGGALGNVSDMEGRRLENSIANIDPNQSPQAARKSLLALKKALIESKNRSEQGFRMDFGEYLDNEQIPEPVPSGAARRGQAGKKSADDILREFGL